MTEIEKTISILKKCSNRELYDLWVFTPSIVQKAYEKMYPDAANLFSQRFVALKQESGKLSFVQQRNISIGQTNFTLIEERRQISTAFDVITQEETSREFYSFFYTVIGYPMALIVAIIVLSVHFSEYKMKQMVAGTPNITYSFIEHGLSRQSFYNQTSNNTFSVLTAKNNDDSSSSVAIFTITYILVTFVATLIFRWQKVWQFLFIGGRKTKNEICAEIIRIEQAIERRQAQLQRQQERIIGAESQNVFN